MKKNMYWIWLFAAGLLSACSNELSNELTTGGGTVSTGEGFVKVAINMPSVSGSRTIANADGTADEYAVKSGVIAFFEGTTEADAVFVKAYDLGDLKQQDQTTGGEVSTVVSQLIEAPLKTSSSKNMYALVILNKSGVVNVTEGNLVLTNGENNITISAGKKLSDLNEVAVKWALTASQVSSSENGFLMLNAPLYNGTSGVQTLAPVNVYKTQVEANGASADPIYVERVVAKVDVKKPGDGSLTVAEGGVYAGDKVTFAGTGLGWVLNVTNKNTVPVRNVSDLDTWKGYSSIGANFVGTANAIGSKWSRIYWAQDVNYDKTSVDFNVYTAAAAPEKWGNYSDGSATVVPQYCLENTAPATSCNEANTTSVLIKAKYDIDGDAATTSSFFIMDKVANAMDTEGLLAKVESLLSIGDVLSLNSDAPAGYYKTAEQFNTLFTGHNFTPENATAIGEIRYYKDGECYYYTIPVKHFTNITYTPGETISEEKHLGRYGVVRNNWYEININSVSGPGEPVIPTPDPDKPVDKQKGYIQCEINVLSWAKHSQNVDL